MRTADEVTIAAAPERVFALAADVERWPTLLSHYRWVRIHERRGDRSLVEMAAWRPFGLLRWPAWWKSEMWVDSAALEVRYRHIEGITRGMDVVWHVEARDGGTHVSLVHVWDGPAWPLIRRPAADWVIGPVFIHGIASRTLMGIARAAEREGVGGKEGGRG